jgi:hypothetical protein
MAPTQARTKAAVVTTTVALAVLLAGPASTFGLEVPVAGGTDDATTQVTSTVQAAVETTQQTVATVESTIQPTTQAVAPQQPAAPQVQAPTKAPAAPTRTASRVSAPARKRAAAVTAAPTAVKQPSESTLPARSRAPRNRATERTATARITEVSTRRPRTSAPAESDAPAAPCDMPLLALVPGGAALRALLAIACDAASGLGLPARIALPGGAAQAQDDASGTTTSIPPPARARARSATLGAHPAAGSSRVPAANAATAGQPAGAPLAAVPGLAGGPSRVAYLNAAIAAHATTATSAVVDSTAAKAPHHHGWFSGQSRGTAVLMAILIANVAILLGIALWRLALRWIVPRFA